MHYKAVIFDLDGVLVFTDKYHYRAWKKLAEKLSIEFTEKDMQNYYDTVFTTTRKLKETITEYFKDIITFFIFSKFPV